MLSKFYHVTDPKSVDSILRDGLRPSAAGETAHGVAGVYLTSDKDDSDAGSFPENALFEVTIPKGMRVEKDKSGRTWFVAHGHIPPSHLKLLRAGERK